jgi:hypothetical protein
MSADVDLFSDFYHQISSRVEEDSSSSSSEKSDDGSSEEDSEEEESEYDSEEDDLASSDEESCDSSDEESYDSSLSDVPRRRKYKSRKVADVTVHILDKQTLLRIARRYLERGESIRGIATIDTFFPYEKYEFKKAVIETLAEDPSMRGEISIAIEEWETENAKLDELKLNRKMRGKDYDRIVRSLSEHIPEHRVKEIKNLFEEPINGSRGWMKCVQKGKYVAALASEMEPDIYLGILEELAPVLRKK